MKKNGAKPIDRFSQMRESWIEPPTQQTVDWVRLLIWCAGDTVKLKTSDVHPFLLTAAEEIMATTLAAKLALQDLNERRDVEREFKMYRRRCLRIVQQYREAKPKTKQAMAALDEQVAQ